jgi:5-hydroxyisourate hydrolase
MKQSPEGGFDTIGRGQTNSDGRVSNLLSDEAFHEGVYAIFFDTRVYFESTGRQSFYPEVTIVFEVKAKDEHYHVPLLLSPYGYSTYRGS